MTRSFFTVLLVLLCTLSGIPAAHAQSKEWISLHRGNASFRSGDYKEAESQYREALKANPQSSRAAFNLGDVYLAQKNAETALRFYDRAAKLEKNKQVRAMAYHNMGYIRHISKDYARAIEDYKQALRNNPKDEDTRYNLVLCQKQKQQQDKQKNQQQKDKDERKSGKGDQKQQQQQEKSQQKENSNSKQNNTSQESRESNEMSRDNAEQLLNLSRQSEQQTLRKVKQAPRPRPKFVDKNW